MTPESTARDSASHSDSEAMPPSDMVITCAPLLTAWSIACATLICDSRTTLSMARIGMCFASGALPEMSSDSGLTSTLDVEVPWPGLPVLGSGSVGSFGLPLSRLRGDTMVTPLSSACLVMPVSGCATTMPAPRLGRPRASAKAQACGMRMASSAQCLPSAGSGSAQQPGKSLHAFQIVGVGLIDRHGGEEDLGFGGVEFVGLHEGLGSGECLGLADETAAVQRQHQLLRRTVLDREFQPREIGAQRIGQRVRLAVEKAQPRVLGRARPGLDRSLFHDGTCAGIAAHCRPSSNAGNYNSALICP